MARKISAERRKKIRRLGVLTFFKHGPVQFTKNGNDVQLYFSVSHALIIMSRRTYKGLPNSSFPNHRQCPLCGLPAYGLLLTAWRRTQAGVLPGWYFSPPAAGSNAVFFHDCIKKQYEVIEISKGICYHKHNNSRAA
ncbi:hypothetical protein [Oscillibacter sp. 1-3]|uniref:hypothetical protein n=1 Tax=Oscillibacter sp. 1-3 TaxID=1235797 RepID=UPI001A980F91|nr:hypothetical protein [Oscillibacter sp. 1-3]